MRGQYSDNTALYNCMPFDVLAYIVKQTDVPTLFCVRLVNRHSRQAVSDFIQRIPSSVLLRFLPMITDVPSSPVYARARSQMLAMQLLVNVLGVSARWQNCKNLEAGILAMMFLPHKELLSEAIFTRYYDSPNTTDSEFESIERDRLIERFGVDRLTAITHRITHFYTNTEHTSDPVFHLKHQNQAQLLAMMVSRSCHNIDLQNQLLDCLCCTEEDFLSRLQTFIIARSDRKELKKLFFWILEPRVDNLGSNDLEGIINRQSNLGLTDEDIALIMKRFLLALFHPNWFDGH